MSRQTFGQGIAVAFMEASDAAVELGTYVDAIDELIEAAIKVGKTSQLRRAVVDAIRARSELARAAHVHHPGTDVPGHPRLGRTPGGGS